MPTFSPTAATRTITFETNLAGKLSLPEFIHVARAPDGPITESQLEQQTIKICTRDGSHEPVHVVLTDFVRMPIHMISDRLAMQSHGVSAFELQCRFLLQHPAFTTNTLIAIYFYKHIK